MKFSELKFIKWLIGLPVKTKVVSAVVAGTMVVGSGIGIGIAASKPNEPEHTHSYTQQITEEATCTEKGVITFTCSCNDTYTEEIPATGEHTWDNGEITTEPTCTEAGEKTFTCTVCETATYTEDVKELEHDTKTHEAQAATCTEKGWNA